MDGADNQDRKEDSGAGAGGEPKPAGEHLSLKVKSQEGNEVYFKVKKTTTFAKVMAAYCKKVGADMESVRFLFDGVRLKPDQTPADVRRQHAHTSSSIARCTRETYPRVQRHTAGCTSRLGGTGRHQCSISSRRYSLALIFAIVVCV